MTDNKYTATQHIIPITLTVAETEAADWLLEYYSCREIQDMTRNELDDALATVTRLRAAHGDTHQQQHTAVRQKLIEAVRTQPPPPPTTPDKRVDTGQHKWTELEPVTSTNNE